MKKIKELTTFRSTLIKIALLLTIVLQWSCKKDETKTFDFELVSNVIEVPLNSQNYLQIKSGNGSYSIVTEDENIAAAEYISGDDLTFGSIIFKGKSKGETTLSVTDDVTGKVEKVRVRVTDFYLPLVISNTNHPALVQNLRIFLVNNDSKDVFFFLEKDEKLELQQKGTYEFLAELKDNVKIPYLILRYSSDENGHFANGTNSPVIHKFDLRGSNRQFYDIIHLRFNVNWEAFSIPETKSSSVSVIDVKMTEIGTNYVLQSYIGSSNWTYYIPTNQFFKE